LKRDFLCIPSPTLILPLPKGRGRIWREYPPTQRGEDAFSFFKRGVSLPHLNPSPPKGRGRIWRKKRGGFGENESL